ncbi:MAG: TRAP transporter large permease [Cetobacterium sp.]|uniref:TRAP transporter large permease n=1 Tax=Cetobacterium sp. TaxID=2071632 RepID=UPI002FC6747C
MQIYYPIIILFILFFLNIPIAFSLIGASLYYFIFINTGIPLNLVIQRFTGSIDSFPLLAIPFFIMVGSVMNYSGISSSLMKMADTLTGHMIGGLAQTNILLSTIMGGISGSANADAAMQSKILVPEMVKRGYNNAFSSAVTAASSAISPVIPPGINLIIYALIANVSVGEMFLAGYLPGVMMAISLMITVTLISKKRGYERTREKRATLKEVFEQMKKSIWALLIPFGIIFGMRLGMFTPTEAGAIAVVFCGVIGSVIYKELKIEHIPLILKETVYGTSAVVLIVMAAKLFGYYMTLELIPQNIAEYLISITDNKFLLLMIINALLLVIGMFIEGGAALIILAPLFVPAVVKLGVNPVHFGIILIVNIMIGGVTPPFGSMMFTVCAITKCDLKEFIKESLPFILALLVVLGILTYSETIAMFVPNLM